MTKIALISDSHFGARGDHLGFLSYFEKFYAEVFFPTLEQHNIHTVVHLGDLVERRKYINYYTAHRMRLCFLDKLRNYSVHILAGNHDTYHKNTSEVNSLHELVSRYPNITVYTDPIEVKLHNTDVLMLPWINVNNYAASEKAVRESRATYCMSHLELQGFEMEVGQFSDHGQMKVEDLRNFMGVYSGHYHHKSSMGNIHYLGSPYEWKWSDYADPRGFHLLELETGKLEFIQNPYCMFHKILYNDSNKTLDELLNVNFDKYQSRYVKLILVKKENPYWFEKFIEAIEQANPFDLQIVEDQLNTGLEDDILIEEAQDTVTILNNAIDKMPEAVNKEPLKKLLRAIHDEAVLMQV